MLSSKKVERNSRFFENFSTSLKITHLFRLRIYKRDSMRFAKWRIEFRRSKNILWHHSTRYTYSRNKFACFTNNLNNERIILGIEKIPANSSTHVSNNSSILVKSYSIDSQSWASKRLFFNCCYNYSSFQLYIENFK